MKAKITKCAKCGGSYKMKSGGKIKRYQDAGNTENRTAPQETTSSTSSTPPKPMSKSDFKGAKKAIRQQKKLQNIGSDKLGKAGAYVGLGSALVTLVDQTKNLLKKQKSGGTIKSKKVTSRPKKRK